MNSQLCQCQRALTNSIVQICAPRSMRRAAWLWRQVRSNSTSHQSEVPNGWKAISLKEYKTMIKNSTGSVLFDAKDPNQKKRPLVAPLRPTDFPFDQEIRASHVKVIGADGKIQHASEPLNRFLAELRVKNELIEKSGDRLVLVQVGGLAYLPSKEKIVEAGAEGLSRNPRSRTLHPPWRADPPLCRLFTRDELRKTVKEEERQVRGLAKKKRIEKEIETSWSISEQDIYYVGKRLQEFLGEGRPVSVVIKRSKRWKVPPEEDVHRTLKGIRAAATRVPGAFEDNAVGDPGHSMILDFKIRASEASDSGRWRGLVPEKIIRLSWYIGEKQLELYLKDMRQSLRKGRHVAVKIEDEQDVTEIKASLTPKQIINRIRLESGNVKDAVEITPSLPKDLEGEDAACENLTPWELRFEANSKKRDVPRRVAIDADDSSKQLNLKLDWVVAYLADKLHANVFVHPNQLQEAHRIFTQRGWNAQKDSNKLGEYTIFNIQKDSAVQIQAEQPQTTLAYQPPRERERRQTSQRQARQNSSEGLDSLLNLLASANQKTGQGYHR